MNFVWNSVVKEIKGNGSVQKLVIENTKTGAASDLPAQGIFVYIGHIPNTQLFKGQLEMNEEGYLKVDERLHTSTPGVFAAGESHDHVFRQAVVSAGFGCMAEMEAEKFLADWEHAHKK
jgi:thioredoxin reductase (NADPH)